MNRFASFSPCFGLAAALFAASVGLSDETPAEKLQSGQQPGEELVRFSAMKIAGAEDDGEPAGLGLCYCCKYEGQPLVFVFARRSSEPLAKLVAKLDEAVKDHADVKLQVVVSLLGEDQDAAEREALALEKTSGAKRVPFVIPFESDNGPVKHHIDPAAELTVILVKDNAVVRNFAFRQGELHAEAAKRVLGGVAGKLLK